MRARNLFLAGALALAGACSNAGDSATLPALGSGRVIVQVFFDADASGTFNTPDSLFAGARLSLLPAGGSDTIRVATTDATGKATFDSVPIGTWRIVADRHSLNDSVGVVVGDTATLRVLSRGDSSTAFLALRFGYREVTLAQARAMGPGHRIVIRGTVVSPLQFFHDSSAFLVDPSGRIRITDARHRPGRSGNNVGDSVTVVGTSGVNLGQPVLLSGLFTTLGTVALPVPVATTVSEAHTAKGGTLDAALVSITGAQITDSLPLGPDFVVRIADPADLSKTTDVVIDSLFGIPHGVWSPGRAISVKGVLVPKGDGTWILKPRGGGDITLP